MTVVPPPPLLRRRSALLGALCWPLAGLGCGGSSVAAPAPPTRSFGDTLGVNVHFSQGAPMSDLALIDDLGVSWVREAISWPRLEPTQGGYQDFDPALRERLAFYRERGIGLVALLTLENQAAYPAVPGQPFRMHDPEAFGVFAARVARQLQVEGSRFVLEIGNEPHNSALARRIGGQWQGRLPSPWVDQYVRMVSAAVRQVKAVDRAITVMTNDDMWIVSYWFLEAGLPPELDALSVHPYTGLGPPERTAVAHNTDWTAPFSVVDADRWFVSAVRRLREQAASRLGHAPQIWVTEWGWAMGDDESQHQVPEPLAAAYLPRAFVLAAAAGVEVTCWFSMRDMGDGPFGLVDNEGRRRATYDAYKTLSDRLGDAVLERELRGSLPAEVHAYVFRRRAGRTLVVWSEDGKPRTLAPPPGATAVDHQGRTLAAARFDAAPIYVEGAWSDESMDTSLAAMA